MPDIAKGLGGLMSAFGKKGGSGGGEKGAGSGSGSGSSGSAGANTVFDTYTEIRKISTASLPGSDFAPPAGYKKVER